MCSMVKVWSIKLSDVAPVAHSPDAGVSEALTPKSHINNRTRKDADSSRVQPPPRRGGRPAPRGCSSLNRIFETIPPPPWERGCIAKGVY